MSEDADNNEIDDLELDGVEDMSLEDIQAEGADEEISFESGVDTFEPVKIPLEDLDANNWNPNEMSTEEFNRLCENIEEDGFISALQAVPVDEDGNNMEFEEGVSSDEMAEEMDHARIVGGEHRWSAAKVVGMAEIPTMLVPNKDEEWEKLATVRMNTISGDLDPLQFADLIEEQRQKHDDEDLKHLLGFTGEDSLFDQVLDDVKENVPDEVADEIEAEEDELESIEDLSELLNRIFREHGDDLQFSMVAFSYGGEDNIMYQADDELWAKIVDINSRIRDLEVDSREFWWHLIEHGDVDDALEQAEGTAQATAE